MNFDPIYLLSRIKKVAEVRIQTTTLKGKLTGKNILRGGFVFLGLTFLLSFGPPQTTPAKSDGQEALALKPVFIVHSSSPPKLTALSAYLIELKSGSVLFDKEAFFRLPPASATKIITALVAFGSYPLDEVVEVHPACVWKEGESIMGLYSRERITVKNLLRGVLIASASDAACALANHHPGGLEEFVGGMNALVSGLGLEQTHFVNPSGIDGEAHYSTAKDLTLLAKEALSNTFIQKTVGIREINVASVNKKNWHLLETTNKLLGVRTGIFGVKTGYTTKAKGVFVFYFKKGEIEILGTIMGSKNRFGEAKRLLTWALSSFIFPESTHR